MKTFKMTFAALALLFAAAFVTGCRDRDKVDPDEMEELVTHSSDEGDFQSEADNSFDDIDAVYGQTVAAMGARTVNGVCGATLDSVRNNRAFTLTFNPDILCFNNTRRRSGSITFRLMGTTSRWTDANAVVEVSFNGYRVTRVSDNRSVTLNGFVAIFNVTGGTVRGLASGQTVTHRFRTRYQGSNNVGLTFTFDNGSQRVWHTNRTRSFTRSANNVLTVRVNADTTIAGYTRVAAWGTNRIGNNFYTTIPTEIVASSPNGGCGWWKPLSGSKTHYGTRRDISAVFGLNAQGQAVTDGCPTHFRITWTGFNGQQREAIVPYR